MVHLLRLAALAASLSLAEVQIRIRLKASSVRDLAEPDFSTFSVETEAQNSSAQIAGVNFTVSAHDGSYLEGDYYKYQYTRAVSHLGERVVNQGITTSADNPRPITLSIMGLEEDEHTLLTWHNLWSDPQNSAATIGVSVGRKELTSAKPSIRVDNIWEAQTTYIKFTVSSSDSVEIVYTPTGGDGLVYLNGFEIDTPAIGNQVSFPTPAHLDLHLEVNADSIAASWRAPANVENLTYNLYLGTDPDMTESSEGLTKPTVFFEGMRSFTDSPAALAKEDLNRIDT